MLKLSSELVKYAVELSRASRPGEATAPQIVKDFVTWGVGPRAPQALIAGAKARAMLRGRARADFDDVRALAPAVFRHRLVPSYAAEADGVTMDDVTKGLLAAVPYPGRAAARRERSKLSRFLRSLLALDRPSA